MIKSIRDNYRIYGLKIVKIEKKNPYCQIMDFQTPLLNHITMFSPIWANGKTSHGGQSHLIKCTFHLFFVSSMLISNHLTSPPLPPPFDPLKICSYSSLLLYELTSLPFFHLASFFSASTFYSIVEVNQFFLMEVGIKDQCFSLIGIILYLNYGLNVKRIVDFIMHNGDQ